ncbi:MAG: 3'-5' exoribonuclease YhaM family protein [Methanococcaceae archaeon]
MSKIKKGEVLNHFLMIKRLEVKTARNNKPYLNMELGDTSCSLISNMWENFETFLSSASPGKIAKVNGFMDEYQGQNQIRITSIRCAEESDNISPREFMPHSKRELSVMQTEFRNRVDKIQNEYLKKLIIAVFQQGAFEKYSIAPAGKTWHHSYLSGLLEHTLEMVRICDLMSDIHPEVNRDLLISGVIMHDFGKIEELTFEAGFDYSDKGKLIGHIVISAMIIEEKAKQIENFPELLKNQLIHLVLSHQGKLEFASPVTPKTLESIILYQADELSAKTNAYKMAIQAESGGNSKWTKFLPLIASSLYIPEDFEIIQNNE